MTILYYFKHPHFIPAAERLDHEEIRKHIKRPTHKMGSKSFPSRKPRIWDDNTIAPVELESEFQDEDVIILLMAMGEL